MRRISAGLAVVVGLAVSLSMAGSPAVELVDAPLAPAIEKAGEKDLPSGAILEYWFAPRDKKLERFPVDPSVTGMVDESDKVFAGNSMLKDGEMRQYVSRHGVLQWTTYFLVRKPGKHVFALGVEGMWSDNPRYGGASMLINDEATIEVIPGRDDSVTLDFGEPGLYKMQIRMWWTHGSRSGPLFQDYRVSLKVREPGSLGLRQVTKKDLFYKLPE